MRKKRLVTASQWARSHGISQQAASKALRKVGIEPKDGPFDPEEADQLIEAAKHHARRRRASIEQNGDSSDPEAVAGLGDDATFSEAQRVREIYRARREALEFEIKQGHLRDADLVNKELYALARQVRDQLQTIPDRIDGLLAARTGLPQHEVHAIVADEIRRILENLSRAVSTARPAKSRSSVRRRTRARSDRIARGMVRGKH